MIRDYIVEAFLSLLDSEQRHSPELLAYIKRRWDMKKVPSYKARWDAKRRVAVPVYRAPHINFSDRFSSY